MSAQGLNPSQLVSDMAHKLQDDLLKTIDRNMGLLSEASEKDTALMLVGAAIIDILADRTFKGDRTSLLGGPAPKTLEEATAFAGMELLYVSNVVRRVRPGRR